MVHKVVAFVCHAAVFLLYVFSFRLLRVFASGSQLYDFLKLNPCYGVADPLISRLLLPQAVFCGPSGSGSWPCGATIRPNSMFSGRNWTGPKVTQAPCKALSEGAGSQYARMDHW
jgi:hypothetical protein